MPAREPVSIKGKLPARRYPLTLADAYARHQDMVYAHRETDQKLASYTDRFPGIDTGIIARLFPQAAAEEQRPFERLPCVMGDVPLDKRDFNLHYQDTRLKLAVEEKLGPDCEPGTYEQDARDLMEVISILLCSNGVHGHALWRDMTDNDLDALIFMVLNSYDPRRVERLLAAGHQANALALSGLLSVAQLDELSLEELINYQVFAGTVWWPEQGTSLDEQFSKKGQLEIDDVELFKRDTLSGARDLAFIFDDNGELVWDLALIQRLLNENTQLRVTGVVSTQVVANNANRATLGRCLEHPAFHELGSCNHFGVFEEDNFRSAIDPTYCSRALLDTLQAADVVFIKGVAFFETIQKLPVDTFYAFVVHSHDSQICTGLDKGSGVFVRIPNGRVGYHYLEPTQTLKKIYPTLNTQ